MARSLSSVQILTAGQAISVAASSLLPIYLSRVLSVDDFASFRFATFLIGLMTILGSIGFDTSMYALVGRNPNRARVFSRNSLLWGASCGIVLSVAVVISRPLWSENLTSLLSSSLMLPLIVILVASMMSAHLEHLLVVVGRIKLSASIAAISAVGLALICWTSVRLSSTASAALWAIAVWNCLRTCGLILHHWTRAPKKTENDEKLPLREQFRVGLPGGVSNMLMGMQRLDRLVVAARFSTHDFALYSVGSFEIPLARNFSEAQHQVATVECLKGHLDHRALKTWMSYIKRSLRILVPVVFISVIFAEPIIRTLFGAPYEGAAQYFALAGLSTLVFACDPELLMRAANRGKALIMIQLFSVGIFFACLTIPGLTPLELLGCRIFSEFVATATKYFVLFRTHARFHSFLGAAKAQFSVTL